MEVDLDKSFRGGDVEDAVLAVHFGDELLGGGDEDLGAVVVDLHDGVVAHFEEILAGADLAQPLVDDGEADDFVEVEPVAVEGRELT